MLRTSPAWLKALLLGQLVSAAGSLAWLYLTLWLVDERGRSPGVAGLITAAYGAGAIGGNWSADRWATGSACVARWLCPRRSRCSPAWRSRSVRTRCSSRSPC